MSSTDRRVIALGNLQGELKSALEGAVQGAGLELFLTREPARAFVELERGGALAVLVDMATLGAEQFCKRARSAERLRGVPVIGMSRTPNELGFARVFAWGADDLVPLGARAPLEKRLKILASTERTENAGFGQAVVAEATTQRRALVGRVLAQAGYDVKFAVDRAAVELYASQSETRLVVISAALGDPRRIIDAAARAGALPTWIVTAEMRSVNRLAASLAGLERVAVTSTAGSPEDVLFLANELVFGKGTRRREWRALYATPVAFRPVGSVVDEYGFSYDAGPKGLYVRSLLPCESDDVEVEIRLPARDERVRLQGKIMRRFAFGSGSIASAPPGFGIKLEGPEVSLALWSEACAELIAGASSEGSSPPPRPKQPSVTTADPDSIAPDVALALPPATLTIESVVAPLPVDSPDSASVGDLLAATLDEQTLTEVGTRPVTMDPDTMGVREERPSEYALRAPSEPPAAAEAPPIAPAAGKPPEPPPPEDLARTQIREPRPPLPVPAPAAAPGAAPQGSDWDDVKTAVVEVGPDGRVAGARDEPPNKGPEPEQPKPAAAPPAQLPKGGLKSTLLMGSAPAQAAQARAKPPVPSAAKPGDKPPVASPAAFAGTVMMGAPPAQPRGGPIEEIVEIEVDPSVIAPLPVEPAATPPSPKAPEVAPAAKAAEPRALDVTLPVPSRPEPFPQPAAPNAPAAPAAAPVEANAPIRMPSEPGVSVRGPSEVGPEDSSPAGLPSTGPSFAVILLVGLLALGGGAALVVLAGPKLGLWGKAPAATAAETPTPPPAAASETPPAAETLEAPAPPPPVEATASAAPAASAPPAASAEAPSAAPSASAAEAPAAPEAPAAAVAPDAPVPEFNLNTLPPERGALFVRSSAKARVFVHGTDYGETNTVLVTTCGIRFVRLGHKLGDFIEPGSSYVVKCQKLTELKIEPKK